MTNFALALAGCALLIMVSISGSQAVRCLVGSNMGGTDVPANATHQDNCDFCVRQLAIMPPQYGSMKMVSFGCQNGSTPCGHVINQGDGNGTTLWCSCCTDDCNKNGCPNETAVVQQGFAQPAGLVRLPGGMPIPSFSCMTGSGGYVPTQPIVNPYDNLTAQYQAAAIAMLPPSTPFVNKTNCAMCSRTMTIQVVHMVPAYFASWECLAAVNNTDNNNCQMNTDVTYAPGPADGGAGSQVQSMRCSCCSEGCNLDSKCGMTGYYANMVPEIFGNMPGNPTLLAAMISGSGAGHA